MFAFPAKAAANAWENNKPPMLWTVITTIAIVTLLVGFNALYVAGEFSIVSARKTRIAQMAEEGSGLAQMLMPVLEDTHKLDAYIAASQVGITISSIVLGIYGQSQIAPRLVPLLVDIGIGKSSEAGSELAAAGIAATLVLIILTIMQVVMGELVPKSVAIQFPERVALLTAIPMKWSSDFILKPLIMVLNGSGLLILKMLGVEHGGEHAHVHSPEEIIILVKESHSGGLIDADEREMLRKVFRVRDTSAVEVAVPRPRIVAAPASKSVAEVLHLAAESAYTRIPVYEDDIDHITGFVHLRDLFSLYVRDKGSDITSIIREVPFVPETLRTIDVWERLNETQSYLAIVFDEYGGTSGMITREDLLEELFGELQDEFDRERAPITQAADGHLIVRGDMQISHFNDEVDTSLPHEMSHTIGGLILDRLGRIPVQGESVIVDGIRFTVENITDMSIGLVNVELPDTANPGKDDEENS